MSKHLLSFLLSEINTVRIICNGCGTVVEMSLEKLSHPETLSGNKGLRCKFCNADFDPLSTGKSAFVEYAKAALEVQKLSKLFDLEFVLPGAPHAPQTTLPKS